MLSGVNRAEQDLRSRSIPTSMNKAEVIGDFSCDDVHEAFGQ